jgi:hypothetical protein
MSFISDLFAGGAAGVLSGAGQFAKDIREAITGEAIIDPNKRAELLQQAAALEAASEKAQLDFAQKMSEAQTAINAVEAANKSLFVSGWRPAVGWVCVSGMGYTFLLKPLLPWFVEVAAGVFSSSYFVPALPEVPMGDLTMLLAGLLGLGTLRTIEKLKK